MSKRKREEQPGGMRRRQAVGKSAASNKESTTTSSKPAPTPQRTMHRRDGHITKRTNEPRTGMAEPGNTVSTRAHVSAAASKPTTSTGTKRVALRPHPPRRSQPLPPLPASVATATNNVITAQASVSRKSASSSFTPINSTEISAKRLQHLHATATLLQTLFVRNRNQHRGQSWWRWLAMLRRRVGELVGVEAKLWQSRMGEEGTAAGMAGTAVVRQAQQARLRLEEETKLLHEKDVLEKWLREVLVPKAWAAFTTLVVDQQFAGLGLVLVGVVADVAGFVGACVEGEVGLEEKDEGEVAGRHMGSDSMLVDSAGEDLGQVVQRATTTATPMAMAAGHDTQPELGDEFDEEATTPVSEDEVLDESFDGFSSPPRSITEHAVRVPPLAPPGPDRPDAEAQDVASTDDEQQEDTDSEPTAAGEADAVRMGRSAVLASQSKKGISQQSTTTRRAQWDAGSSGKQTIKKKQKKKGKKRNAIDDLFAGLA
ncbi:uncharacterized protein AB675_9095 [Cyphellophora attinorum]|uniref:RNase MRP protein 1 RNA binding domain-containing protein n=1 Tax=Cyphellophora attinorum TaxID=1664694 RepID=A0A0N1H6M8_9EURO|nr:uncharacterized protein AB675_9095 [Phialophora attinorum]KPI41755.1 hypothetical protein AB675_9095 [Phialophora attinorum]